MDVGRPLGTGAQPGVVLVHTEHRKDDPRRIQDRRKTFDVARRTMSDVVARAAGVRAWRSARSRCHPARSSTGTPTMTISSRGRRAECSRSEAAPRRGCCRRRGPCGSPPASATRPSRRASTTMRSAYVRPEQCPIRWTECTPVVATPLMASLLGLPRGSRRSTGRAAPTRRLLLVDLLAPIEAISVEVRLPTDDRARRVADLLTADPSDDRTLAGMGRRRSARAAGRSHARSSATPGCRSAAGGAPARSARRWRRSPRANPSHASPARSATSQRAPSSLPFDGRPASRRRRTFATLRCRRHERRTEVVATRSAHLLMSSAAEPT